jgi:hypothetical protein
MVPLSRFHNVIEARGATFLLYCLCIVLYRIVLYCTVLYCIVSYCIVLYCIVLFSVDSCFLPLCRVLCIVFALCLYGRVLYSPVLYCIILYQVRSPHFRRPTCDAPG